MLNTQNSAKNSQQNWTKSDKIIKLFKSQYPFGRNVITVAKSFLNPLSRAKNHKLCDFIEVLKSNFNILTLNSIRHFRSSRNVI